MAKLRKKGFTLLELIAVLVIMAILALIVTPLVMNIIRKARISADKRSIDAYGRSIELAIAGYLLDTGKFPTEVSQLTIEYSGNEVVCTTTQLNSDSSVYLDGCTVAGRSVDYHYGENKNTTPEPVTPSYTAYQVGDHVSYNGVTYYVIEDSDTTNDTVKLLKENALTKTEMEALSLADITIDNFYENEYGTVKYGESTDYSTSIVKMIVDAWKDTAVKSGDIAVAKLISHDDLVNNLGYENRIDSINPSTNGTTPNWVYNSNYSYWTMSQYGDSSSIWQVTSSEYIYRAGYYQNNGAVRPVLELNKSADITKLN